MGGGTRANLPLQTLYGGRLGWGARRAQARLRGRYDRGYIRALAKPKRGERRACRSPLKLLRRPPDILRLGGFRPPPRSPFAPARIAPRVRAGAGVRRDGAPLAALGFGRRERTPVSQSLARLPDAVDVRRALGALAPRRGPPVLERDLLGVRHLAVVSAFQTVSLNERDYHIDSSS